MKAAVVYVGALVAQGPPALVAYSRTVPAPQPVAEIVPVIEGQTLSVIVIVGVAGVVHVPGTVVTATDGVLLCVLSTSQLHRV